MKFCKNFVILAKLAANKNLFIHNSNKNFNNDMNFVKLSLKNHRTYVSTILQQFVDVETKRRISTPFQ